MTASTLVRGGEATEAVKTLTAQWYNAVVEGCGLDRNTFQLAQGFIQPGVTSESLWKIFNAIPPVTVTHYWNPAQINNFSSTYGALVSNLVPQDSGEFQQTMGDYYARWQNYLQHSTPPPTIPKPGGILELFNQWQQLNMPPEQGQAAYTAYQQVSQGVVPIAMQKWLAAGGGASGTKAYNATVEDLKRIMSQGGPGKSVHMDSSTTSSDVTNTWAKGEVGGFYEFFVGEASVEWKKYTEKISASKLTIDATFKTIGTFTCGPLAEPSTDPILGQYVPWYHSAAVNLAYQNNNYYVWKHTPPTWDGTFGDKGDLRFFTTSLIVVSGVDTTVSSEASFSEQEQEELTASAQVGVFPFFEAKGSGGWNHKFKFDDSGRMTVSCSVPPGVFVILGAIVTPTKDAFGGGQA
ncbi:hypothetical protein [Actinocrispum wychmicini]|uniref:Uncharacterized protein n=1 Tax=Actinocrispum wychmicini TaxID=1213861 RepID=A0A4R2JMJ1_9PSEU|nr:hypothetical protein [Actinocrispum wychmicini]TCO58318.1 hypothetical protein EV192_105383 [Actinocrispum wychmicini]